jgi:hypothetical protein
MLGGLVRPGVSLGPEDFLKLRRPPAAPAAPAKSRPIATLIALALYAGLIVWFWPYIWRVGAVLLVLLLR